ncbi:MAG: sulfurtransferase [Opitutales bacterium]
MLVETAELDRHLHDPSWIVFDCRHDLLDTRRGARVYGEGHVPGAFFAPIDTALAGVKTGRNGRHPLPEAADFAAFLNRHGVGATTQIVAYDDAGGQYAARLWWLACWIGVTRVALLNGGLVKWLAEGRPVTAEKTGPRAAGSIIARPDMTQVRSADEVLRVVNNSGGLIIDARAPERFRGEVEPVDPVAGHIPTACNRFHKLNLNPDQTWRDRPVLRAEFEALLGPWPPRQVIHHCGSGITACVNLLAMELAGLPGSALYAGSWSEWIGDPAHPVRRT